MLKPSASAVLPLFFTALAACAQGAGGTGTAAGKVWALQSLDGAPFTARATLSFPAPGTIAGDGPCNAFSGQQTATPPAFRAERIVSTMMACAALDAEGAYLRALGAVREQSEAAESLTLSGPDGPVMVFTPVRP